MQSKLTWCVVSCVAALACLVWRAEVMATARISCSTEVLGDVSTALVAEHWKAMHRGPDQGQSGVFISRVIKELLLNKFDWRFIFWSSDEMPASSNAFERELLKEIPKTKPKNGNFVFADRESPDGKQRISYVPIYASSSCMQCHDMHTAALTFTSSDGKPSLAVGDLMAVAIISIPHNGN